MVDAMTTTDRPWQFHEVPAELMSDDTIVRRLVDWARLEVRLDDLSPTPCHPPQPSLESQLEASLRARGVEPVTSPPEVEDQSPPADPFDGLDAPLSPVTAPAPAKAATRPVNSAGVTEEVLATVDADVWTPWFAERFRKLNAHAGGAAVTKRGAELLRFAVSNGLLAPARPGSDLPASRATTPREAFVRHQMLSKLEDEFQAPFATDLAVPDLDGSATMVDPADNDRIAALVGRLTELDRGCRDDVARRAQAAKLPPLDRVFLTAADLAAWHNVINATEHEHGLYVTEAIDFFGPDGFDNHLAALLTYVEAYDFDVRWAVLEAHRQGFVVAHDHGAVVVTDAGEAELLSRHGGKKAAGGELRRILDDTFRITPTDRKFSTVAAHVGAVSVLLTAR